MTLNHLKPKDPILPSDLKLQIGSKEEAIWTDMKAKQEESIRNTKVNLKVAETLLALAKDEIAKEKERFK